MQHLARTFLASTLLLLGCSSDLTTELDDPTGQQRQQLCSHDGDGDPVAEYVESHGGIDNLLEQSDEGVFPNPEPMPESESATSEYPADQASTNSNVLTEPTALDVDGDGLDAAAEAAHGTNAFDADSDDDGLLDGAEVDDGTNPLDADSDGDGWTDGPTNLVYRLRLRSVANEDGKEHPGHDDLYLVVDDRRFPWHDSSNGVWRLAQGVGKTLSQTVARRVVPGVENLGLVPPNGSLPIAIEAWEDDADPVSSWAPDDELGALTVDLLAHKDGDVVQLVASGGSYPRKYRHRYTFEVTVRSFADPSPLDGAADDDGDGIDDRTELDISSALGGIADPLGAQVFVEVDQMVGRGPATAALRQVTSQYLRYDVDLWIFVDDTLPADGCLSHAEAQTLYANRFDNSSFGVFHYVVFGGKNYANASGASQADALFVDTSTFWIGSRPRPQAGTLIHELGHQVGLSQSTFSGIDRNYGFLYDSAMSYSYQATLARYSNHDIDGPAPLDFDDSTSLVWGASIGQSFASTTCSPPGCSDVCAGD